MGSLNNVGPKTSMTVSTIQKQMMSTGARRKGSYGIDVPYLLPIPVVLIAINIVNAVVSRTAWPLVPTFGILACMGCGLYTSRRGKFAVWAELLDQLRLRGDERLLDLGCGRGAVLLMAAQRLST